VPVVAMGPVERAEVDLVDDVDQEPGEMTFGEPAAQVGWEQEGLAVPARGEPYVLA
jgi:hypothetical protein